MKPHIIVNITANLYFSMCVVFWDYLWVGYDDDYEWVRRIWSKLFSPIWRCYLGIWVRKVWKPPVNMSSFGYRSKRVHSKHNPDALLLYYSVRSSSVSLCTSVMHIRKDIRYQEMPHPEIGTRERLFIEISQRALYYSCSCSCDESLVPL